MNRDDIKVNGPPAVDRSSWLDAFCCMMDTGMLNLQTHQKNVGEMPPKDIPPIPNYRLRYFDVRGLGEPIRLLFHYAKVPFEDIRVSQEEWDEVKKTTRYGKLPELEIDGQVFGQSMAIARYLARKFGLDGGDDWLRARCDEAGDLIKDLTQELSVYVGTALGLRPGDKVALRKNVYRPTVSRVFPLFVKKLEATGFLAGTEGPTWVDFFLFEYFETLTNADSNALKKWPTLSKFVERIRELPELRQYLANRKHSLI